MKTKTKANKSDSGTPDDELLKGISAMLEKSGAEVEGLAVEYCKREKSDVEALRENLSEREVNSLFCRNQEREELSAWREGREVHEIGLCAVVVLRWYQLAYEASSVVGRVGKVVPVVPSLDGVEEGAYLLCWRESDSVADVQSALRVLSDYFGAEAEESIPSPGGLEAEPPERVEAEKGQSKRKRLEWIPEAVLLVRAETAKMGSKTDKKPLNQSDFARALGVEKSTFGRQIKPKNDELWQAWKLYKKACEIWRA